MTWDGKAGGVEELEGDSVFSGLGTYFCAGLRLPSLDSSLV